MTSTSQDAGRSDNPLLAMEGLPRFDLMEPDHVVPAATRLLTVAGEALATLERTVQPTWDGCLGAIEAIERPFEYAWGPVGHLLGVKNSPPLREAQESVLNDIVAFGLRLSQSKPLYAACKAICESEGFATLSPARQRAVELRIRAAELAGIGLAEEQRERFNVIAQQLSQLSTQFSNNVLDATKAFELVITDAADIEGMPASLLAMAEQSYRDANAQAKGDAANAGGAGPWRFTLDPPSFVPFMEHCRSSRLRERLYRAFVTRASEGEFDNGPLIGQLLALRAEQAAMLGFSSYAEMSLESKMAPAVAAVEEMFETLRAASWDASAAELDEMKALAAQSGVTSLAHWDIAFWAERLREQKFDYTDEELRPYFPLETVLQGMFELVGRLFGITVVQEFAAPVWHNDVRFFRLQDENGQPLAAFYLDPYSRPENKRGGAWMDTCLSRRRIGEEVILPVAHLVCNSTPPVGERPSLMSFREVETLFHEFGHGLQHMLTTVDDVDVSGINGVEWDAVELPSQFMENWCYQKATIDNISGHFETGAPLPEALFEKICASRTFRAGSMMLRQLTFGILDMALHHSFAVQGDGQAVLGEILELQRGIYARTSVLPMLPEDRFLCSFGHIFAGSYAAGYYSYKWAEVLSADAFSAFEDAGLDDPGAVAAIGRRFRETVLALGGSQHPMDVFQAFRGREPSPSALLRHCGLGAA